jgi:tetratricopeptide (TPR) repeat protein
MNTSHCRFNWFLCFCLLFTVLIPQLHAIESTVKISEEQVVIPTYLVGEPERYPMFYTHESYQGAQKRIYPYALQDHLTHERAEKTYTMLTLENEYVRLSLLPEIGGRLFGALDKTNHYNFFYQQHVIKPALIGMLGAWISGGIEWCVFHHHRNTTFMPLDYTLAENPDGSKTIWFGETERRHRMKWLIGITLYPGKSYMETTVKFFNRTDVPHSILYWANVAVHVNEDYQILFPPSVDVATYHSKIDFTHWPISQGRYRGQDYTGVDISWWKNSPGSNSFFAWDLQEDFMGGYDHGKEAGMVHVANHHVVCSAKLWEWGTGSYGRMWDNILTDEDGPYAELMVGAWSDNQPDYSWIKPHEVKTFRQYWYPVRETGGFKNASLDAVVNLEAKEDKVVMSFNTSSLFRDAKAELKAKNQILFEETITISPEMPFRKEIMIPEGIRDTDLRAALHAADGRELVSYQPVAKEPPAELPEPVQRPPAPEEIQTIEELYLTGLRVEQIHNPSVDPFDYYEEALKRDPGDARTNTIVGINYLKQGRFAQAENHLRTAIERVSAEYTRPINTEAYYYLGLVLKAQEKGEEAYTQFYRATWDYAFHSAAYYQLAELSCRRGDFKRALEQIDHSLSTNQLDTKAMNLKALILRKLGKSEQAQEVAQKVSEIDPLDFLAMNEQYCLVRESDAQKADDLIKHMRTAMRDEVQSYLELATDYMNCGQWQEAVDVLSRPVEFRMKFAATFPLVHYYLGYLHEQVGNTDQAKQYYTQAGNMPSDYCFPFRMEDMKVLESAVVRNPGDAKAWYYLGNLLFDIQPERAQACWEKSAELDDSFGITHRNLGWVYSRIENDIPKAIEAYEKALASGQVTPRLFIELDSLYEKGNIVPERRYAALERHHDILTQRVESFTREIRVLVLMGKYDQAIDYLTNNYFHVQEGDDSIHDVYMDAHLLKGLQCIEEEKYEQALQHFQKASEYPENLSVGRPERDPRAPQVAWYIASAYEALGQTDKAQEIYQSVPLERGRFGGSESLFYQGLILTKTDRLDEAGKTFDRLIESGRRRLSDSQETDFFAKFGERETQQMRNASAHYLMGLGYLGKGQMEEAKAEFRQATQLNLNHVWAKYHLQAVVK